MVLTPLHPDRLLPADPTTRSVARTLYAQVRQLPVLAAHGHVDARLLLGDQPFADAASLLVTGDHYVLRVLHSVGVAPEALGLGGRPVEPTEVWRSFCAHWDDFRGTAMRAWLEYQLVELFDVELPLLAGTATESFDAVGARLAEPAFRPRALFDRFGIEVLSTTDRPGADFAAHDALKSAGLNVVPTLRPDELTDPTRPAWRDAVESAGVASYDELLAHLRTERQRSAEHGAVATDHGHALPLTEDLEPVEARTLFGRLVKNEAGPGDAERFAANMVTQMALMALDDGLVLQLHTGVVRDHDGPAAARFGSDIGSDFPLPVHFTTGLRPMLERVGDEPGLRIVLFTMDESAFSRDLAPLASYYPAVHLGAPWWFLDAPDAMARHFAATVESAGYAKLTGFVDDTRAFCSIPARHGMARRAIASHLARQVTEHRLSIEEASEVAYAYAYGQPKSLYRL